MHLPKGRITFLGFFSEFLLRIIPNAARRKQASPKKNINILGII